MLLKTITVSSIKKLWGLYSDLKNSTCSSRGEFEIRTDHHPLLGILKPGHKNPDHLSPRLLRFCLFLNSLQYTLKYVPGKQLAKADVLSRLPLPDVAEGDSSLDQDELLLGQMDTFFLLQAPASGEPSITNIAKETPVNRKIRC
jgi:hypothetical protein